MDTRVGLGQVIFANLETRKSISQIVRATSQFRKFPYYIYASPKAVFQRDTQNFFPYF